MTVRLKNPLPFELRVGDIRLLTNGVVFESLPETVVLPPPHPPPDAGTGTTTSSTTATTTQLVTLHGTPREHGALELLGYSTHTVGVKSDCYLKSMLAARSFPASYQINVIPALPQLSAATSLPPTATFSGMSTADSVITSASLTIFNGESAECIVRLTNNSAIPIEYLDESVQSGLDARSQAAIFQWSHEELQAKLPIPAGGGVIEFPVRIYADADFLGPLGAAAANLYGGFDGAVAGGPASLSGAMSTLSVSGHTSLPSRVSSPIQTPLRRNEMQTSSFRSAQSGHSSLATISLGPAAMNGGPAAGGSGGARNSSSMVRHFEMQLRLRYAGGAGLSEGYCRQCAIAFNLEFLPSAQVTNWDVLPAEM